MHYELTIKICEDCSKLNTVVPSALANRTLTKTVTHKDTACYVCNKHIAADKTQAS